MMAKAEQSAVVDGEDGGLSPVVTQNVPKMRCVVLPGNVIGHEGVSYYGEGYVFRPDEDADKPGDEVDLDGPTAIAFLSSGAVTVKGAV